MKAEDHQHGKKRLDPWVVKTQGRGTLALDVSRLLQLQQTLNVAHAAGAVRFETIADWNWVAFGTRLCGLAVFASTLRGRLHLHPIESTTYASRQISRQIELGHFMFELTLT